jgi:hypothetical protein
MKKYNFIFTALLLLFISCSNVEDKEKISADKTSLDKDSLEVIKEKREKEKSAIQNEIDSLKRELKKPIL